MDIVVLDEHTLGINRNGLLEILHTSILKGSPFSDRSGIYVKYHKTRPATLKDFESFRVSPKGFEKYLHN